jgi:hypothetical protein
VQPDEPPYYTARHGAHQLIYQARAWESLTVARGMVDLMERDLSLLLGVCRVIRAGGIRLIVLLYRGSYGLLEPFSDLYYREVERSLSAERFAVVAAGLGWREFSTRGWLRDACHPNAKGNSAIARAVSHAIGQDLRSGN